MWRIHLTIDDLVRIRISPGADPMWELLHSVSMARSRVAEAEFGAWRRHCRRALPESLHQLAELAPPCEAPAFLMSAVDGVDIAAGLDALVSTPREVVRADVAQVVGARRTSPFLCQLREGRAGTLRALGALLRGYFDGALRPHWAQIRRHVGADLAARRAMLAHVGVGQLLGTLAPGLRWEEGGLRLVLARTDTNREIRSDGRGLLLRPTFFAHEDVTVIQHPDRPLVLGYAAKPAIGWFTSSPGSGGGHLGAIVGRTRALILQALADRACTTTELADRLGLCLGSASQHAAKLGRSGLVTSTPRGKFVVHRLSPLGAELVETAAAGIPRRAR